MSSSPEQIKNPATSVEELDKDLAALLQQQVDLGLKALDQGNPDMAITFFQSARSKVSLDFPFYDHLTHNLLLAYKQRIEQLFRSGRSEETKPLLENILALDLQGEMAGEENFRRAFADNVENTGRSFFENYLVAESLTAYRRAIEIEPSPTYYVNLTNALSILKQPALLSDFTSRITPAQLGKHLFIACLPKSASTFLRNVLIKLTGYRELFSVYAAVQNEHDLYLPSIERFADQNTVTQQHCRASEANIHLMQAFGIRPVVLVRNIFDAMVSLLDFYNQGAYFQSYFRGDFMELDEDKKMDLLIDNMAPWYLQFVASWELAEKEGRLEVYWLGYENLIGNKVESIQQLLEFYGLGVYRDRLQRAISDTEGESRRNRFNKGIVGRGITSLTDAQKQRIIALTEYHPEADFGKIGL
jgi:tetratricopeptide (TPR) repeat protein